MLPKLLELHFAQLQAQWAVSKYNSYSDLKKQKYHQGLAQVISFLENETFSSLDDKEVQSRYHIISFIFKSLEFLNHSTTSTIPFEMVYVLQEALTEWSPNEHYLIVTSLTNGMNQFSFDNSLTFNDLLYTQIELLCGVTFSERLIQINLPESTSKDYLANVVLYHELGHFVEKKYEITRVAYIEILTKLEGTISAAERGDIIKFFPYLADLNTVKHLKQNYNPYNGFSMHIGEYFCDLFASQYISDCSNNYLTYITQKQSTYSQTHPSTTNRVEFVNHYLQNTPSYFLTELLSIVKNITSFEVKCRAKTINSTNFEQLTPVNISDGTELHSLFVYGWKIWLGDWNNIAQASGIKFKLSTSNVYDIVNNLVEKSIGNFIIQTEWAQGKKTQNDANKK